MPAPPDLGAGGLAANRPFVRNFLMRVVADAALADDLTQETFIRAEAGRAALRQPDSVRSWLCAIALNAARDHFRAAARAPAAGHGALEQLASDDNTERDVLRAEMAACIGEYLFRLPAPQRDVVALHDMAGLKHREIAAALELSEANSRVLLHRGRAALRSLLQRDCIISIDSDEIPCERRPAVDCDSGGDPD